MKCFSLIFFLFTVCFFSISNLFGKEIKPKVLVYGDNIEAFAAAIQSARSNVPTLWVIPSADFCANCDFEASEGNLVGGIWMGVLQEITGQKKKSDSLFNAIQHDLSSQIILNVMNEMMNKQNNLTILKDIKVASLINKKKNIDIVLSNKRKLSLISVVDASEGMDLFRLAKVEIQINKSGSNELLVDGPLQDLGNDMLRTLVAIGAVNHQLDGFTAKKIVQQSIDNLFFCKAGGNSMLDVSSISLKMAMGQVIGASAAYCAFFKTTSEKLDVRKLQTELMSFESRLLPFVDIRMEDPNFNALQKIFLVGILPWNKANVPFQFIPMDSVSIASVRPVIQQLYSRSQLWFVDNKTDYFSTRSLIELIKVIAFRGDDLDLEVEKAWKRRFKFNREFDLNRTITRYEFAVLLDAYAEPFAKNITLEGKILR